MEWKHALLHQLEQRSPGESVVVGASPSLSVAAELELGLCSVFVFQNQTSQSVSSDIRMTETLKTFKAS